MLLGKTEVPHELGVHAFEGDLLGHIGLLDPVTVSLLVLVVVGVILALCHNPYRIARVSWEEL